MNAGYPLCHDPQRCVYVDGYDGRPLLAVVALDEGRAVTHCIDLETGEPAKRIPKGAIQRELASDLFDGHHALVVFCDDCGAPEDRDEAQLHDYEGVAFCRRCVAEGEARQGR